LLDTIIAEENLAKAKKTDEGMSASAYKEEEGLRQNIVGANPRIAKLRAEVETLKSRENLAIKAMEKDTLGFSPEKIAAVNKLSDDRIAKESELKGAENALEARLRIEGNKPYLKRTDEEDQKQAEETAKAQAVLTAAASNARLASAFAGTPSGAGTTPETPKPPPPLNDLAKRFADIETPRKVAEANIVPDTNKQWTNAKNQVVEAVGGMDQLVKITDEVFQNNIFGVSLPADRARLINAIVSKIPGGATKTIKGFEQKSERSGLESVSAQEIIASLVDDVIRARGEGVSAAAAAAAKPIPNQDVPAVGNSTVIPKR